MSQKRCNSSTASELDISVLENIVKECVRYIFCREGSKIPIKRADISKHLQNVCETPSHQMKNVIKEANEVLKRVYGYKLVQLDVKSGVQYMVILDDDYSSLPSSILDLQQRRLLVAMLTHIYMSGGPVKEDDMWKFLGEAGLLEETDYAGRKAIVSTLTKQMYLLYTKVKDGETARNVFEWGQRANEELPKIFLLKKMAEAFDKRPDHWCEQYKEAMEG